MSDKIAQNTSSRGRVLKRTGMDEKKMAAIMAIGGVKDGGIKRTDQYEVSVGLFHFSIKFFIFFLLAD